MNNSKYLILRPPLSSGRPHLSPEFAMATLEFEARVAPKKRAKPEGSEIWRYACL